MWGGRGKGENGEKKEKRGREEGREGGKDLPVISDTRSLRITLT
jgi:hypothetical protein